MTDLEDRIRHALHDPRREVPPWPDPLPRIRRAARRQRGVRAAGIGAVTALVAAAAIVPTVALRPAAPAGHGHGGGVLSRLSGPAFAPWTRQLSGEVAYECGFTTCLMRPDGTGRRTISSSYPLWDAAWSPSGRQLAFRGYYGPGDGQYDLYEVGTNGCRLTRIARGVNASSPSWSPTGREIAYSPAGGGIDAIGTDGSGHRTLTRPTSGYTDAAPAWSATGRVAFVRSYSGRPPSEIYTMNAAGRDIRALTHGAQGFDEPAWSPDGRLIAFAARPYPRGVIEVATASGTGAHRVSPASWNSSSPTWVPHGQLVFLAQRGTQESAYVVNPDGTGLRLLYPGLDAANSAQIAWGARAGLPKGC